MKKVLYIFITLLLGQYTLAQDNLKRADLYFERAFYSDAIPLYEQLLPKQKNSGLIGNLADSYYRTFDMKSAERWYTYLISKYGEKIDESYYFKLNQSLKANGKYDEAAAVLLEYYSKLGDSAKVSQLRKDAIYLDNVRAIGKRFTIKNLKINTATSEFGGVPVDSNLMYTATRKDKGSAKKVYRWNNQNYLDIYNHPISELQTEGVVSVPISKNVNTKMHEGTFAITKDRKTLYFTRNDFLKGKKKTDDNKISNLQIYRAEWVDNDWKNVTALPFNSSGYSTEHPALNADETKLYFASDRPGGFGSFDLYAVDIQQNGSFGNVINLGALINTDKKEQFPFLTQDNTLYFSSNGHPGFGLLDVFIAKQEKGDFLKPDNLGYPINSGYDDFSLYLNSDATTGYFSSNRPEGKGSDDIYSFSETKPLIIEDCKQFIAGTITDQITKQVLPNSLVTVLDSNGTVIQSVRTDAGANFRFEVLCASTYTVKASYDGYESNSKTIATSKERSKANDGSTPLLSVLQKERQAKEQAEKKRQEQIKREQEALAEKLNREKKAKEKAEKLRLERIKNKIDTDNAIVKDKERTIIKTKAINFDYSMWYLRRESRERLVQVIQIMNENPEITVEIGTHTDGRGNAAYNRQLSQKRANSVKEYLVKNGIDTKRIIAKGYGESQPIINCKTDNACDEEQHELNRRCEFLIVKWE